MVLSVADGLHFFQCFIIMHIISNGPLGSMIFMYFLTRYVKSLIIDVALYASKSFCFSHGLGP